MKSHLEQNLSLLAKVDPALAERMRKLPYPAPGVTAFESRSGKPSLKAVGHDGAEILLHSEYDPAREAEQLVKTRGIEPHDCYILNGFGLGYMAQEVFARADKQRWIGVVEAHEGLFRAALDARDLAPVLTRARTMFFVGRDGAQFQAWARSFFSRSGALSLGVLPYPPCLRLFPSFYAEALQEVETGANRYRMEIATAIRLGENMDRNMVLNLPAMARSHGVNEFRELFKGGPAFVVAAGPSLNEAIPLLREHRGRIPIVVVGKALKRLLAEGIVPDAVVSLDMNPNTGKVFRGYDIPASLPLVFDQDCWHEVAKEYPGPLISYQNDHVFSAWTKAFFGELGTLPKGLSVVHSAYFFAVHLGASPVLLVGADLSFPAEKTHADGVTHTWGGKVDEVNRKWIEVPGVNGKPVRSLDNFKAFVTTLETAIVKTGVLTVQTSENGAFVRGAEHLSLKDALAKYAGAAAPVEQRFRAALGKAPRFDAPAFARESQRLLGRMEAALEAADRGLRLAQQARKLDLANRLDREEVRAKLARAGPLQKELLQDHELRTILSRLVIRIAGPSKDLDRRIDEKAKDDPERLALIAEQHEVIFQGYAESLRFLLEQFRPTREEMLKLPSSGS